MKTLLINFLITISLLLFSALSYAQERYGLMVIAHGSPSPQWTTQVLKLEENIRNVMAQKGDNQFSAIRIAFMEFSEPSIDTVIKDFESLNIDRVYAIPLLIAPSGHSIFDIPTIFGLYGEKDIINELKNEGIKIINTKLKITIGPTLNNSDILKQLMLDRLKELSKTPESEAIVIFAHGDKDFEPIWSNMCKEIGYFLCAKTGVEYFDHAFIEMGASLATEGLQAVLEAAKKKDRIIILGLYLSSSVSNMITNNSILRVLLNEQPDIISPLSNKEIVSAEYGLLPDKNSRIARWIVDTAIDWVSVIK